MSVSASVCVKCSLYELYERLSTRHLHRTPSDGEPGLFWEESEEEKKYVATTNTKGKDKFHSKLVLHYYRIYVLFLQNYIYVH